MSAAVHRMPAAQNNADHRLRKNFAYDIAPAWQFGANFSLQTTVCPQLTLCARRCPLKIVSLPVGDPGGTGNGFGRLEGRIGGKRDGKAIWAIQHHLALLGGCDCGGITGRLWHSAVTSGDWYPNEGDVKLVPAQRTSMLTDLYLRNNRRPILSPDDVALLEAAAAREMRCAARDVLVRPLEPLTQCTLLLDGFVERSRTTPEGKRQIVAVQIPGDFVDLHSYPLKRLEHSIVAITDIRVALFPHPAIRHLTEQSATLTELLWRSTMVDAAVNREWIVAIGAQGAAVRLAHLFCEMFVRLGRIDRVQGMRFDLPLTQIDLADATGLTAVHANRMIRQLREDRLVTFRNGVVEILDWDTLRRFADFDPAYLFLD